MYSSKDKKQFKMMNTNSLFNSDDSGHNEDEGLIRKAPNLSESMFLGDSLQTNESKNGSQTTKRNYEGNVLLNQLSTSSTSQKSQPSSESAPSVSKISRISSPNMPSATSLYPLAKCTSPNPPLHLQFKLTKKQHDEASRYLRDLNSVKDDQSIIRVHGKESNQSESGYSSNSSNNLSRSQKSVSPPSSTSLTPWTDKLLNHRQNPSSLPSQDYMPFLYPTESNSSYTQESFASTQGYNRANTATLNVCAKSPICNDSSPDNRSSTSNNMNSFFNSSPALSGKNVVGSFNVARTPQNGISDSITFSKQVNTVRNSPVTPITQPIPSKAQRFKRTADSLQRCGLWDVALKTGDLMKRNNKLQKELAEFKGECINFLKSVIKDPQNHNAVKKALHGALLTNSSPGKDQNLVDAVVSATIKFITETTPQNVMASSGSKVSVETKTVDSRNTEEHEQSLKNVNIL